MVTNILRAGSSIEPFPIEPIQIVVFKYSRKRFSSLRASFIEPIQIVVFKSEDRYVPERKRND